MSTSEVRASQTCSRPRRDVLRPASQPVAEALEIRALLAADPTNAITLSTLGSFATGGFGEGAAEIVAHDPATQRLFVVNAGAGTMDVLSVADPANPTRVTSVNVGGGGPNSVAVSNGLVAVAVEAATKTDPGRVAFYDTNGAALGEATVGALPDMVTFTPDGKRLLVANEGEPNDTYTVDPVGSVSVINVSRGVANLRAKDVKTIDFTSFNAQQAALVAQGVRVFGPGATLAQDLEPEFIAISADSKTAYVTLQENNALAIVNARTGKVKAIRALGTKDHASPGSLETFTFGKLPTLGRTAAREKIALGGFSGLFFEGTNPKNGNLRFVTHPDRGPNAEPVDTDGDGVNERPFALPDFQPEVVRFELNRKSGKLKVTRRIGLTRGDGTPLTGLPNLQGTAGLANADEVPIDLRGNVLDRDPLGADLEGIVVAPDGSFWMVDEYRPAIYHFSAAGALIDRFVPQGANAGGANVGAEALPAVYAQRRANRGFEAVALEGNKLYAFVQSPLDNPDVANDANSRASVNTRILEFDITTRTTTAEYLYVLEGGASDKIGDAVSLGGGKFLVMERDDATGPAAQKKVFQIDLAGATNLTGAADPAGTTIDRATAAELLAAGIAPVGKAVYADLIAIGYDAFDKPEGLALVGPGQVAVINDNDFGLEGTFDPQTGLLTPNPDAQVPTLGLITARSNGLDASDEDAAIDITNRPLSGLYMPDAIVAFAVGRRTFLVTANEGDARDYEGFGEEERVADVVLDPTAFPNAAELQADDVLGRLRITRTLGDTDGDGDFDKLYSFGSRSFSIWNDAGALVFDSGDDFEQITARELPADFNSTNDENGSFDNRSDDKGPEPEAVAVGVINGRTYAFIGLERVGGIMVYDVTDPERAAFVHYFNPRNFAGDAEAGTAGDLGPEGLKFIPAADSPNGRPMLAVGNEVSGTVSLYQINVATD